MNFQCAVLVHCGLCPVIAYLVSQLSSLVDTITNELSIEEIRIH